VSLDYYVWADPRLTADEFAAYLVAADEGQRAETETFRPSRRLAWFRRDILRRYPPLEVLADGTRSPWSATPPDSSRLIDLNVHSSATDEQLRFIFERAMVNGLYLYDAQNHELYRPGPSRWQLLLRRIGLGRLAGPDP
jgi:hypothetical protein